MRQKTTAEDELVRPKSIGVPLTKADSEKLSEVAKKGKRSRQLEAMLRLHDHLKLFSRIPDDWTVAQEELEGNKKITVILTAKASTRLSDVAKNASRSRVQEATIRLHDHLRRVPEITGDYWEITTL
ncbi:TraY domain-containing protein [Raoultella ornithinolytica]|uniref:TraY domain-containing protein n=1 Tax=Raoultella ornithinolytica TaxID=54291 RepID=UPI00255AA050|nr:TraY domain-containing protein [Raoultella ornithinolytica]MDL4585361.1 TraY domain-containing protein [Raoultella ornithinolytica]MDV1095659.1 TraY domain-containing protein [Raoultella ornithinolytica]MDV1123210.1 TraY domain-containing protein [Raoultella ornithinolytica]MDV1893570.1 TraY domain-containing protein [Raoultella ornithinolytica]